MFLFSIKALKVDHWYKLNLMRPVLITMFAINMRPIFSLPICLLLFFQIVMRSKMPIQSDIIKNGLRQFSLKDLIVINSLCAIILLFVINQAWIGISFSENGGYEAVAPIVSLTTCLCARALNGKWLFQKVETMNSLKTLGLIFIVDLILRATSLPGFQLDFFMTEFKYGGLFPTSNVAGYLACTCLVLSKNVGSKSSTLFWFAILILTASRTSIAVGLFILLGINRLGHLRGTVFVSIALAIGGLFVYLTNINWSFESKLLILERFFEVIQSSTLRELLFGTVGGRLEVWRKLDVTAEGTLLSPHNPFVKIALYYGLFGVACLGAFLIKGNRAIAVIYLLHCASGIVPFLSLTQFVFSGDEKK
jgi:hypothetical protein